MTHKKKQHYVPLFYLRRFSCNRNKKSINLYNIKIAKSITGAAIKNQCYEKFFYGKDGFVENILSNAEASEAVYLKKLEEKRIKPEPFSIEFNTILMFIAMQHLRTKAISKQLGQTTDMLMKDILETQGGFSKEMLAPFKIEYKNPVLLPMSGAMYIFSCIYDLGWRLLINKTDHQFVTSDHPVVIYNQFMEKDPSRGTTGFLQRGIKIFFPLSPSVQLLLFDSTIYRIGPRGKFEIEIFDTKDVEQINRLQFVNAGKNIFFERTSDDKKLENFAASAIHYRVTQEPKIKKFVQQETRSKKSSLLVIGKQEPQINLNLSFLWTYRYHHPECYQLGSMQVRNPKFCLLLRNFEKEVNEKRLNPDQIFEFLDKYDCIIPSKF